MIKICVISVLAGAALAQQPAMPSDKPDDGKPVEAPEKQEKRIVTTRFTAALPDGWVETPNDWGALVALKPRGDSAGRAMDVWREALFVAQPEQTAFLDRYAASLKPSGGGVVDPVRFGSAGNREIAQIRLRTSAERFQEYWLAFTDDGVFVIVITTTDHYANADFMAARALADSMRFTPGTDAKELEGFCKGLAAEREWLAQTGKRVARLTAPWRADDGQQPAGIAITNVSAPILPGDVFALIALFRKSAIPEGASIEREGWATDTPDTWNADFTVNESGSERRYNIALVFGSKKIFALRLSSSRDRYDETHRAYLSALAAIAAAK
ncbi:MAG: hypothetical protein L6Q71_12310 [Planctomycetes bacterium]|nr:hypothetical protein [Planctomycetota bacterium]NUQ33328.1 hypothetical protein [Planctomycetaceae bacterium]